MYSYQSILPLVYLTDYNISGVQSATEALNKPLRQFAENLNALAVKLSNNSLDHNSLGSDTTKMGYGDLSALEYYDKLKDQLDLLSLHNQINSDHTSIVNDCFYHHATSMEEKTLTNESNAFIDKTTTTTSTSIGAIVRPTMVTTDLSISTPVPVLATTTHTSPAKIKPTLLNNSSTIEPASLAPRLGKGRLHTNNNSNRVENTSNSNTDSVTGYSIGNSNSDGNNNSIRSQNKSDYGRNEIGSTHSNNSNKSETATVTSNRSEKNLPIPSNSASNSSRSENTLPKPTMTFTHPPPNDNNNTDLAVGSTSSLLSLSTVTTNLLPTSTISLLPPSIANTTTPIVEKKKEELTLNETIQLEITEQLEALNRQKEMLTAKPSGANCHLFIPTLV